jgi:2-dehydro-3-deoxyphosphogluconate aldolase/(4S)-4-hydroxy-2-oxoglutarate aldolase
VREHGKTALIGAGTVTTAEQAEQCIRAGAEFIVSPGLTIPVLTVARALAKLAIPGALTPTELMHAHDNGAKLIKIFPCGNVGGPKYLQSLKAPFPNATLIPTGGVNVSNAADYIRAGAFALGVGGDLVNAAALRDGNLAKITDAARQLVLAVRSAREAALEKVASLH